MQFNGTVALLAVGLVACVSKPTPQSTPSPTPSAERPFAIVIHGGAGGITKDKMTSELEAEYRKMLATLADEGYAVLAGGGTSMDAVEAVIVRMEDSPLFNAGKGSVFTHEGTIEMDASVMDGATGNAGAVAGVKTIRNPIRGARRVMTHSKHVLFAGEGADAFAKEQGLATEPAEYFRTDKRWNQLERIRDREEMELDHGSQSIRIEPGVTDKFGTVGVVALDKQGNLAAGTSTGGMNNKRFGRVGDSPIVGAGTYAKNSTAAISCTGHGEFFIREAVAHSVSARMQYGGQTLEQAAKAVIHEELTPIQGEGGVIAVDAQGHMAMVYNTAGMYRAFKHSDGRHGVAIWEE